MRHTAYTPVRIDKFRWLHEKCHSKSCDTRFNEEDVYVVEDSYGYPCCDDSCALMSDVWQGPADG
jgi:hypothetical protein